MTVKSGSHSIGPENGRVTFNTYVGGMGSKLGHDLVIEATRWRGTVNLDAGNPAATRIDATIDARSWNIIQAQGGVKPLSGGDRDEIAKNSDKTLNTGKFPEITFTSTGVQGAAPNLKLQGNLTISGQSQPVTLDVRVQDGPSETKFTATGRIAQTAFGVKPYSKLGALKVKDEIDVQIEVTLPA
ncbi:MAG TPA: YceI family protein [Acidimicrobiales bacterium]|nr:YceI family protein [Acidimicrobiales bacterium]